MSSVLGHFVCWRLGLAPAETQTTDAERDCLAKHAAGRLRLVEIGVWHGVTTCRLRRSMAPNGEIIAVDPYPPGRLGVSLQQYIAHAELRRVSNGTVRWVRATGKAAAQQLAHEFHDGVDFVFIDGDHSYEGIRADWEAWSAMIAPGGVIALHDSRPTTTRQIQDAGSVRFTAEVILRDPKFEVVATVDSLTVLQRKP